MATNSGPLTEAVYYILLSAIEQIHGYGIMQHVEEISNGRVKIGAGTLYGAISTILKKGWIIEVEQDTPSRKKEYLITVEGKEVLAEELERLKELTKNGIEFFGGNCNGEEIN